MSTRKKGKESRAKTLRRRTWGLRMALWAALLLGAIGVIAFVLLSNGGGGDDQGARSSRFAALHRFDTPDYHSLALDPSNPQVVLFGHHNGLQKSEDGGQSWKAVVDEQNWDAMNTVFDPFARGTMYIAGHNVFFRSDDGGETWAKVQQNLPSLDLHTFAASPNRDNRFYAIPAGQGLYVSENAGQQWQLISEDVPPGSNSILELPNGTLLLGASDVGILRSEDGGQTWTPSRNGIETGVIFTLKSDPAGRRIYAGTNQGLFVSTDGGKTWSQTALDDTLVLVVGVNPADPLELLVVNGEGHLYRSRDGGARWG